MCLGDVPSCIYYLSSSFSSSFFQSKIQFTDVKLNSEKVFFNAVELLKSPSM